MGDKITASSFPFDPEIEKVLLGLVMVSGDTEATIKPEMFFIPQNRCIAESILRIRAEGNTPDYALVISDLSARNEIEKAGGAGYILSLCDGIPKLPSSIPSKYIDILEDKRKLRLLMKTCEDIILRAGTNVETSNDLMRELLGFCDDQLIESRAIVRPQPFSEVMPEAIEYIERAKASAATGESVGLLTGLVDIDAMIAFGIRSQDIVMIGGRPGTGKTSLLLSIIASMAQNGKSIFMLSLEMDTLGIAARLLSMQSNVPAFRILGGFVTPQELDILRRAAEDMSRWKVWIDGTGGVCIDDIHPRVRSIRHDLDVIMIDYLQLLRVPPAMQRHSENEKISHISSYMRTLCKTLSLPIICCVQLNRSPDKRSNAKPKLADLRGSGQMEQDADLVMLLHKDREDSNASTIKVIIAKNRNGKMGEVELAWEGTCMRFSNLWSSKQPRPALDGSEQNDDYSDFGWDEPSDDQKKDAPEETKAEKINADGMESDWDV